MKVTIDNDNRPVPSALPYPKLMRDKIHNSVVALFITEKQFVFLTNRLANTEIMLWPLTDGLFENWEDLPLEFDIILSNHEDN